MLGSEVFFRLFVSSETQKANYNVRLGLVGCEYVLCSADCACRKFEDTDDESSIESVSLH